MKKEKAGYIEGVVSVLSNGVLFAFKLWAGMATGSIALTADAWHTLSDSLSSFIVIASARLSAKKPDKKHPYGHGRWEQIAALLIAFLLAVIAFDFFIEAITNLHYRESPNFGAFAIGVIVASIIFKELLAQYAFYLCRKSGNLTVKADGWHHRTDSLSSVVVLAGIFLSGYLWWIDSFLGIVLSAMLLYAAFNIGKEAVEKYLGEKPSMKLIDEIINVTKSVSAHELHPHHFHIHNYGTHRELTFHIKFESEVSIGYGHEIATEIETRIFERLGVIATIHIEPHGYKHDSD
ncbi:cation diffusion facilitator family transporter [Marinilabiliaceae bacterium ANBcel2]|nr:cation diffusion facilitator family transporter [Marinilabiliaceae bacterium ANBcel2]